MKKADRATESAFFRLEVGSRSQDANQAVNLRMMTAKVRQ